MQRARTALSAALAALATSSAAAAQTSVHARGSFAVSYSDNVLAAPSDGVAGVDPVRSGDVFFLISPGFVVIHESGRAQLVASYEHPIALYVLDDAASTLPNVGSANRSSDLATVVGNFALSARDEMIMSVNASRLTTRQIALTNPEQTQVGAQLSGDNTLVTVGLNQALSHAFAARWRGTETLSSQVVQPLSDLPQPTRWSASAEIGAEYLLGLNMFSGQLSHTFVSTSQPGQEQPDSAYQLLNTFNLRWRRDLGPTWSSELSAGVTSAYAPLLGGYYIGPVVGGTIGYSRDGYTVDLRYNRALVPNPLAGPTSLSDTVQLVGGVPLGDNSHVAIYGSAGSSYNQVLSSDASVEGSAASVVSDVALRYDPPYLPNFSLRYQHIQQFPVGDGTASLRAFYSNQVTFAVGYNFPGRQLPRHVGTGASRRVDQAGGPAPGTNSRAPIDPGPNRGLEP